MKRLVGSLKSAAARAAVAALLAGVTAAAFVAAAGAASTFIVISEFGTRGPGGINDEFIELYNKNSLSVEISGWTVRGSSSGGGDTFPVATIPADRVLGAGCHYLLAQDGYTLRGSSATPDQTYGAGIADGGGIAVFDFSATIVDAVGMSAGSAYLEGTPLTAMSANVDQSYERKPGGSLGSAQDTDDNAADFAFNASTSDPQGLGSECIVGPPTATSVSSLSAVRAGRSVVLHWRTEQEANLLGFNVYRGQRGKGKWVRLNRTLVPSVFAGTTTGHAYSFLDRSAPNGKQALRYRLQAVNLDGTRSWIGSAAVAH